MKRVARIVAYMASGLGVGLGGAEAIDHWGLKSGEYAAENIDKCAQRLGGIMYPSVDKDNIPAKCRNYEDHFNPGNDPGTVALPPGDELAEFLEPFADDAHREKYALQGVTALLGSGVGFVVARSQNSKNE